MKGFLKVIEGISIKKQSIKEQLEAHGRMELMVPANFPLQFFVPEQESFL